jgi:hypothetical protein
MAASGVDIESLTGSPAAILALPTELRHQVVAAFADSITTAFMWAVPFAAIGLVLTVVLPELPLRKVAHVGAAESPEAADDEPLPTAALEL